MQLNLIIKIDNYYKRLIVIESKKIKQE